MRIILSSHGLAQTHILGGQEDFTFRVGCHEYKCTRFAATFISPYVSNMIKNDPCSSEYCIDIDDQKYQFKIIIKLMEGESVEIGDNSIYLIQIAALLGNDELISLVVQNYGTNDQLSVINCIQILIKKKLNNIEFTDEITFISSHLSQINIDSLKFLDDDTMEMILSNDDLVIENEDWLLNFIMMRGNDSYYLMKYVRFEYVSDEYIKSFVQAVGFNEIDEFIWNSLTKRLVLPVSIAREESKRYLESQKTILYEGKSFDGIIHYLCGKHIDLAKGDTIRLKASGNSIPNYDIFNPNWSYWWESENEPNSYIQFDFRDRKIVLFSYLIRSSPHSSNEKHMISWSIEGSNDGNKWDELDRHETSEDLNSYSRARNFACCNHQTAYRYFKLKQLSSNSSGTNSLIFSNIEFFGKLIEK